MRLRTSQELLGLTEESFNRQCLRTRRAIAVATHLRDEEALIALQRYNGKLLRARALRNRDRGQLSL